MTSFLPAPLGVFEGEGALDGEVGDPEVVPLAELLGFPLVANDEAAVSFATTLGRGVPADVRTSTSDLTTLAAPWKMELAPC